MSDDYTELDLTQPPNPQRAALGHFVVAMCNLLSAWGLDPDEDINNLSVHYDGRFRRLDVAHLDAGGHLASFAVSVAADPTRPDTFGQTIGLPDHGGTTH